MSVDGTDFRTKGEVLPNGKPDKRYYSHKFKGPAYRYEVAICIRTSSIVWVSGPYFPGQWNDLLIFRDALIHMLGPGERVEADDGYMGECPAKCVCPGGMSTRRDQGRLRARVRNRHETLNERLKNFQCIDTRFRHGGVKHGYCTHAACVLTQLSIQSGEPLMDMREYDDTLSDAQVEALFGL